MTKQNENIPNKNRTTTTTTKKSGKKSHTFEYCNQIITTDLIRCPQQQILSSDNLSFVFFLTARGYADKVVQKGLALF